MQHTRPDNSASSAILNADQVYIDRTELPSALIAQFVRLIIVRKQCDCRHSADHDLDAFGDHSLYSPRLATT
jgi:hypothetical protein